MTLVDGPLHYIFTVNGLFGAVFILNPFKVPFPLPIGNGFFVRGLFCSEKMGIMFHKVFTESPSIKTTVLK